MHLTSPVLQTAPDADLSELLEDSATLGSAAFSSKTTSAKSTSSAAPMPTRNITQAFRRWHIKHLERAYDNQFQFAPFYAYLKLKEQEASNLGWIVTCIAAHKRDFARLLPIFTEWTP